MTKNLVVKKVTFYLEFQFSHKVVSHVAVNFQKEGGAYWACAVGVSWLQLIPDWINQQCCNCHTLQLSPLSPTAEAV